MNKNKYGNLTKNCSLLQKFAEDLFKKTHLRHYFPASSQSVHRTITSQKFSNLFKSEYWQQLMEITAEVIEVTDPNYDINKQRKFINSDQVLWLRSLTPSELNNINEAYQTIKNFHP